MTKSHLARRLFDRKIVLLSWIILVASPGVVFSADKIWTEVTSDNSKYDVTETAPKDDARFRSYRRLTADLVQIRSVLAIAAPDNGRDLRPAQLALPMPQGGLLDFFVSEAPVMEQGLAEKFPQIRTYKVRAVTDAAVTGRIDIGPHGFHAFLLTAAGSVFIDPAAGQQQDAYVSYFKGDYPGSGNGVPNKPFSCGVAAHDPQSALPASGLSAPKSITSNEILVYRLAAATTGEYSQAVAGGDAVNTLAEVITAINRVTQIFERDLGIRMLLVANNDSLIYTDAASDPYTNLDLDALLIENQTNIDSVIGSANYDIGHVFATADGGLANFDAACSNTQKAGGATGLDNPVGDAFYIDYLAHEFGHQFGASHSFNGTTGFCDGNRSPRSAFEPGSGSTIMSYGGICDEENVQEDPDPLSPIQGYMDPTFHAGSIAQVLNFVQGGTGSSCPVVSNTGNSAPVVNAGADFVIPAATAFNIDGSATDVNAGDSLTHQWDQMDSGFPTNSTSFGSDLVTNALFRSFIPIASASRTFPQLATLLDGVPDKAEALPTTARTLNFRLTVRDGNGGVSDDDMRITVDNSKGPFVLLQPNTALTLNSLATHTIEWDTACTEQAPISCSEVDILWSADGGDTFSSLAMAVPNDGVQSVTFPATNTSTARVKLACSDNIFFDVTDVDFALAQDGSGTTLVNTGNGSGNCGTGISPGADIEPNDMPASAQSVTIPFSVSGTANSTDDVDDYFTFSVTQPNVTISIGLSIAENPSLARNNHDLYLLDSSGTNIIAQSTKTGTADESISMALTGGSTYYVRVTADNTVGQRSAYALSISSTQTPPPPPPPPPVSSGGGGGAANIWILLLMWIAASLGRARQTLRSPAERSSPVG